MSRRIIACNALWGSGGLGRHLLEAASDPWPSDDRLVYCSGGDCPYPVGNLRPEPAWYQWAQRSVGRLHPGWRSYLANDAFDFALASSIGEAAIVQLFQGQALRTFRSVSKTICQDKILECPTAHVSLVRERYAEAMRRWPFDPPWLNQALEEKSRIEYEKASLCVGVSQYVCDSLLDGGVHPDKVRRRRLTVDLNRYSPGHQSSASSDFIVLYVGALSVAKGVPLLVEAFTRMKLRHARLVLCGGWGSHGMRKYIQRYCTKHKEIVATPGDPMQYYRQAHVVVHPSFQDGFGYVVLEAMAAGVPVVVSEDTGAKEIVASFGGGHVVPTGRIDPLCDVIRALYLGSSARERLSSEARQAALRWCRDAAGAQQPTRPGNCGL